MYVDCRGIVYDDLTDDRIIEVLTFSFTGLSEQDIIKTLITKYKENKFEIDLNIIRDIARKCIIIRNAESANNIKTINEDFFKLKKDIKKEIKHDKQDDTPQLSLF